MLHSVSWEAESCSSSQETHHLYPSRYIIGNVQMKNGLMGVACSTHGISAYEVENLKEKS
jgi:hypothetical protein